jgi:hypothetical protein
MINLQRWVYVVDLKSFGTTAPNAGLACEPRGTAPL